MVKTIFLGIQRWTLLLVLMSLFIAFFYLDLHHHFNFASFNAHRQMLWHWTNKHYLLAVVIYISTYFLVVAASIPVATILTIAGGFLFGMCLGTLYTVIAATLGATVLFIAVKLAFKASLERISALWIKKMRNGFKKNAFSYLLMLRLIPLFPFWLVNVVPALLNVSLMIFMSATFIGIIPGAFIYAAIGHGLDELLAANQAPNLNVLTEPHIFLALLGLGILVILPAIYQRWR